MSRSALSLVLGGWSNCGCNYISIYASGDRQHYQKQDLPIFRLCERGERDNPPMHIIWRGDIGCLYLIARIFEGFTMGLLRMATIWLDYKEDDEFELPYKFRLQTACADEISSSIFQCITSPDSYQSTSIVAAPSNHHMSSITHRLQPVSWDLVSFQSSPFLPINWSQEKP